MGGLLFWRLDFALAKSFLSHVQQKLFLEISSLRWTFPFIAGDGRHVFVFGAYIRAF